MNAARPTSTQRQILQRLRIDQWRSFASLKVSVGDKLLRRLEINGWIERRVEGQTLELKLTIEGLEALRAKIPNSPSIVAQRRAMMRQTGQNKTDE